MPESPLEGFLVRRISQRDSPEFGRGGRPDPEDHPEVEEDEEEEGEGARRADVLPVTAELDVRGVLKQPHVEYQKVLKNTRRQSELYSEVRQTIF